MSYEHILYDVSDSVATITLNRPDKLNAYTATMGAELEDAFIAADEDDAVRVIIVTGAGRGFCAGADISGGASAFDTKSGNTRQPGHCSASLRRWFRARSTPPKPSIAAINGPLSASASLACRWISDRPSEAAVSSSPAARPGAGSRQRLFLPRLVGLSGPALVPSGRVFPPPSARGRPGQRGGPRQLARARARAEMGEYCARLAADAPHAMAIPRCPPSRVDVTARRSNWAPVRRAEGVASFLSANRNSGR